MKIACKENFVKVKYFDYNHHLIRNLKRIHKGKSKNKDRTIFKNIFGELKLKLS